MSLTNKIKRGVKLGIVCISAYYIGKTCDRAVFGQEINKENKIVEMEMRDHYQAERNFSERDTIRKMDYQTLR